MPELGDRLAEVPTDRPVHLVCQSGGRSAQGAELLTAAGLDAVSVTGGTRGWIASGHPTTTG
ncbi:rhodanese-like domain-containing protein [Pseudonocardia parietis]|uniref:rhodanese-like domain-containing protein n=1 Tax=Pseudonocardia parietis TaxID=570936 RepID=UPI001FD8E97E|nr:rhodanese-like domain-containing protein [Pseudonocardia parietis]